jgi:hypothetical protein
VNGEEGGPVVWGGAIYFLILLDFVVGLPLAQTVHEFSRINEWKDLHSGIRGLIRGWLTAKPQIPLEPKILHLISPFANIKSLFVNKRPHSLESHTPYNLPLGGRSTWRFR